MPLGWSTDPNQRKPDRDRDRNPRNRMERTANGGTGGSGSQKSGCFLWTMISLIVLVVVVCG